MNENKDKQLYIVYGIVCFGAILFFVFLYGVKILNPLYTDWLYGKFVINHKYFYGKDNTQHFIGAMAFIKSNWCFPIGNYNSLSYPYYESVIFTDSIPLLAVICKVFRFLLPNEFQYFGLWGLFCFIMQGVMSVRILRHFTNNKYHLTISSLFFVIVPIVVWRMFIHTALDSQWLILMALEPLFAPDSFTTKRKIFHFTLIAFLCSTIHFYLYFYCAIILFSCGIYEIIKTKRINNFLLLISTYILTGVFFVWILGGFSQNIDNTLLGLRVLSMNLNSFFDSYNYSVLLPGLSRYIIDGLDNQFEGYAYLGVGIILAILLAIICLCKKRINRNIIERKVIWGITTALIVAFIIALSPRITLGSRVIIDIPLPSIIENIWGIFRSTGRASWILVYIIMLLTFIYLFDFKNIKVLNVILTICLIVQLIDNMPLYLNVNSFFYKTVEPIHKYNELIPEEDFWNDVINKNINEIMLMNTTERYSEEFPIKAYNNYLKGEDIGRYQYLQYLLGDFSMRNNYNFNYFRFSRKFYEDSRKIVMDCIDNNSYKADTLYVFGEYNKLRIPATGLNVYYVDGVYFAYMGELLDKYKISYQDIKITCKDTEPFNIDAGNVCNIGCFELAKGKYYLRFVIDNNDANRQDAITDIVFLDGQEKANYDYQLVDINGNEYLYEIEFFEGYSGIGPFIVNLSDTDISVENVSFVWSDNN